MTKTLKNYILVSIAGVLAVGSIFLTIETAVNGSQMAILEKQEKTDLAQKRDLEATLVKTLSNSELVEKSSELGFVKPTTLVYVKEVSTVANLP